MATWVKPLCAYLEDHNIDPAPLLRRARISPRMIDGEDARIPFDQLAALFELSAIAIDDDSFGFHFGQTLATQDAGMIGYVGLSAPSFYDAVLNLEQYRRVYSDAVEVDTGSLAEKGEMAWDFRVPVSVIRRQFQEFSVTNLIHSFRDMTRSELRIRHVAFPHLRKTVSSEYRSFFGGTVEFGAPHGLIRFRLHDLHLSVRTADSRLHAILQDHCRAVMANREAETQALVHKVERLIMDRLSSDRARLDIVAAELGMSNRTLTRRLRNENTTFNAIVDSVRQDLAKSYLSDSAISLTEIAYLLGYSEVSAFNHAYKRWTGSSPSSLRKGLR
ncbi:AraC family transcriptional regulator [Seohaeicola saemankumensis]|nr:AraC family transcriptional regulator [Seohaeicola saemankumensis]MCA0871474.1 AraC family transcriptional regulator [Seohaeicola saemankumensis]